MLTKYCEAMCCSLKGPEMADPEQLRLQQQELDAGGGGSGPRSENLYTARIELISSVLQCRPALGEMCRDVEKMNHGP
jgi:hypothetical protein